jgi:four helix bundle protein
VGGSGTILRAGMTSWELGGRIRHHLAGLGSHPTKESVSLSVMGNFRQLSVWKRAHGFALEVHRCTKSFPVSERYGLTAQMRRASVSVVSNIAEGCGRHHDRELAYFLRIARGSVREVESQLLLSRDLGYLAQDVWTPLDASAQEISKMLFSFASTVRPQS